MVIYDELCATLGEEQKKKLFELEFEQFMRAGQWNDDCYDEGLEAGFKSAIRLIFDTLLN